MKKGALLVTFLFIMTTLTSSVWSLEKIGGRELPKKKQFTLYGTLDGNNPELEKQEIIDSYGWGAKDPDEIKDLLPEEFYEMVKHPETWGKIRVNVTPLIQWKGKLWHRYQELTEKYKGTCRVSSDGELLNYIGGCPFPEPKNGIELYYNFDKRFSGDDRRMPGVMQHTDRAGFTRFNIWTNCILYYFGRLAIEPKPVYRPNPSNIDWSLAMGFTEPYTIQGMITYFHRYLDPNKDDDMWMYFPIFRRTRRMSTKQKQDSLGAGSIVNWTNGENFYDKPTHYTWKLLGRKEMLSPRNGRLEAVWEQHKYVVGIDNYYQKINNYVLEARSEDPTHMYSKMIFYVDPYNWFVPWSLYYDRKGRPWHLEYFIWTADANWVPEPLQTYIDLQRVYSSTAVLLRSEYNQGIVPVFYDLDSLKREFPVGR